MAGGKGGPDKLMLLALHIAWGAERKAILYFVPESREGTHPPHLYFRTGTSWSLVGQIEIFLLSAQVRILFPFTLL